MILNQILSTILQRNILKISLENLYVDLGAKRIKDLPIKLIKAESLIKTFKHNIAFILHALFLPVIFRRLKQYKIRMHKSHLFIEDSYKHNFITREAK